MGFMSEKRQNFERLAEKRVTEAMKKIRLIGNLSNKGNYDYAESHVKQIFETLDAEIRLLRSRFKEGTTDDSTGFTFKKS
jgi:transcription elongation GreA/GreB family factor